MQLLFAALLTPGPVALPCASSAIILAAPSRRRRSTHRRAAPGQRLTSAAARCALFISRPIRSYFCSSCPPIVSLAFEQLFSQAHVQIVSN